MATFSQGNQSSRQERQDYSRRSEENYRRRQPAPSHRDQDYQRGGYGQYAEYENQTQGDVDQEPDQRRPEDYGQADYGGERYGRQDQDRYEYYGQRTSRQGHYSDVGYGSQSKGQFGLYGRREYGDDRYAGIEGYREERSGGLYGARYRLGRPSEPEREVAYEGGQRELGQHSEYGRQQSRGRGFRGRGPKGYRRSDERLTEEINDRLTDDDDVDAADMEVQVENGEVTLNGTVNSREEKRRAEDIAEQVSGVTNVQNNLRIHRQAAR